MRARFPRIFAIEESVHGNPVRQLHRGEEELEGTFPRFRDGRLQGFVFQRDGVGEETIVVETRLRGLPAHPRLVRAPVQIENDFVDLSAGEWLSHPKLRKEARTPRAEVIASVLASWRGAFAFKEEDPVLGVHGLRPPQIGAVHAVLAHWSVSSEIATVVMPTGTGKTDTMLSILVASRCVKVLVVVPTDALRSQLGEKFLMLGVLQQGPSPIVSQTAQLPVVCSIEHIPTSIEEVDELCDAAQVLIATSSVVGRCEPEVRERFAAHIPFLFVDEAHHAEAPTWSEFRRAFSERHVVQFTATPFREDGRPLAGRIVYKYPLRKAQAEGYFRPIRFEQVVEFNPARADHAIARKAIEVLRRDWNLGHIVMARVDSVSRAADVLAMYAEEADLNAVEIHTGIRSRKRRDEIRAEILSKRARVVVCVDMLGEGFDLPELKIAAFHDIRKSLAVTLQLAGRFTRARQDLGDATFIANTADVDVQDELRHLYARDPDWNLLLPDLTDRLIGEQVSVRDFLAGFTPFASEVPIDTIRPAISTVVYKIDCANWTPGNFRLGLSGLTEDDQAISSVNEVERALVILVLRRKDLDWSDVEGIVSWEWELYVAIWDSEPGLLYINASNNDGVFKSLAHALAGPSAILIRGPVVFRSLHGIHRLKLQSVGLTEQLGKNIRYTGRMGADIEADLPQAQRMRAQKTVIAGSGFSKGEKVSVGASRKGRIWSHRRDRIPALAKWCREIGRKLIDETINTDRVLAGTLEGRSVSARPDRMPIAIDWPEVIWQSPENYWQISLDGVEVQLGEVDLILVQPAEVGDIRLALVTGHWRAELSLRLFEEEGGPNYEFVATGGSLPEIRRGRGDLISLVEFFYEDPPTVWFFDGSSLEGVEFVELRDEILPFHVDRLSAWAWDVDIRRESQGDAKDANTVQAKVIRELLPRGFHLIIDDDGPGEAADVVCIRLIGEDITQPREIHVEFFHCKYSGQPEPGARVEDLYEVCGQAQKSAWWMSSGSKKTDLFTHLLRRAANAHAAGRGNRYERGDETLLLAVREASRRVPVTLKISIVQPGVQRARASRAQLTLLAVTEAYLAETYRIAFDVITSA
jgi:superfamily II DNA or RNA helicase